MRRFRILSTSTCAPTSGSISFAEPAAIRRAFLFRVAGLRNLHAYRTKSYMVIFMNRCQTESGPAHLQKDEASSDGWISMHLACAWSWHSEIALHSGMITIYICLVAWKLFTLILPLGSICLKPKGNSRTRWASSQQ